MVLNNLEIIKICPSHFKDIVSLSDEQFGVGYISKEYLKKLISTKQNEGFVALYHQKVVGYVLLKIAHHFLDLESIILKDKEWFKSLFQNNYPVGVIETIVVDKGYNNRGIGKLLVQASLNQLRNKTNSVVSFLWQHPNGTPLETLLTKYQFKHQKTIKNYWFKDSILKNYNCKYCGQPCYCQCMVYYQLFLPDN